MPGLFKIFNLTIKISVIITLCFLLIGNLTRSALATNIISVDEYNLQSWGYETSLEPVYSLNGYNAPPIQRQFVRYGVNAHITTSAYQGVKLANITALEFSSFEATPQSLPVLKIDIINLSNDPKKFFRGKLIYEPYYEDHASPQIIYSWNTRDNDSRGNWWLSGVGSIQPCSNFDPCTWNEILQILPTGEVPLETGQVTLYRNNIQPENSYTPVDTFIVGVMDRDTVYKFNFGDDKEIYL